MGQSSSNMIKKMAKPWTWWAGQSEVTDASGLAISKAATPFVFKRWGSQYFDEDGDMAHEFYEQVVYKSKRGKRRKWRKVTDKLQPQGEIDLEFPRLHVDLPVVICEITR